MLDIYDIHDYSEDFLEKFLYQTLPAYDLFIIRSLRNDQKTLIDGSTQDIKKISDFLQSESEKKYPMDLLIILGTAENSNPKIMLSRKRVYFKIKFNQNHESEIGTPGYLDSNQPYNYNDQLRMFRAGISGVGNQFGNNQIGSMKGIIDMQVGEAVRAVRNEYDEIVLKKESEALRRHVELEKKFEEYKLAVQEEAIRKREQDMDERERAMQEQYAEMEARRLEGLGTVKEYTKVIAGGLLEFGKAWFGFDFGKNDDDDEKSPKSKNQNSKEKDQELSNVKSKYKFEDEDDTGFELANDELENDKEDKEDKEKSKPSISKIDTKIIEENLELLRGIVKGLRPEARLILLGDLLPEEDEDDNELSEVTLEENEEETDNSNVKLNGLNGVLDIKETEVDKNVKTKNNNGKSRKSNAQSKYNNDKTIKSNNVKTGNNDVKTENDDGRLRKLNGQSEYNITNHFLNNEIAQNENNNNKKLESTEKAKDPP